MTRSASRRAALVTFAALAAPFGALAQSDADWPSRPITVIVPGAPGGTLDTPMRIVAVKLSQKLGQPVVVDNKAGSGGILGTLAMLRAPADGYTLLAGNTGPQAINYTAYHNLPYTAQELVPLSDVISFANVLVVNAQSPYKTVEDLVAAGKREPGKLNFGSAGIGQTTHLSGELFNGRTGIAAVHVPYRGSSPTTAALLGGEISFIFDNLTQVLPHIQAGKLRALAVTTEQRHPHLPQVPTMAEAGVSDFISYGWMGLFASSKTPVAVRKKIAEALIAVMHDPEVAAQIRRTGGIPGGRSQAEFGAFVETERGRWGEAAKVLNLTAE